MTDDERSASSSPFYRLRQAPFVLRWTSIAMQLFVPFVLYVMIGGLFVNQGSVGQTLAISFLGMLAAALVSAGLFLHGQPVLRATISGILVAVIFLVSWMAVLPLNLLMALYLGLNAFILARVRSLATTNSAADVNRRTFRVDTIILVVTVVLYSLFASGSAVVGGISVTDLGAFCLLLYVIGRMYTLWGFERLETRTNGASRAGVYLLIAMALIITLWGPFLLIHGLALLAATIAMGLLPLLYILAKVLPFHLRPRPLTLHPVGQLPKRAPNRLPHAGPVAAYHSWTTVVVVLGIGMAVAAIIWLLLKSRQTPSHEQDPEAETPTVRRSWVRIGQSLDLLPTTNPVRLQYQSWLRKQHRRGVEVSPYETARQVIAKHAVVESDPTPLCHLLPRYEQARYGQENGHGD